MRKPNIDELQADNTDLKECNKSLSNRIESLIQEANDLRIENNELREWNESLMKELSEVRAMIRVNCRYGHQSLIDIDMAERIKTLEAVNKRHQEEIKKVREENSQLESMLDDAIEILLAFLFNR